MNERLRGIIEMSSAMLISGSIGWFVLMADRPVLEVVFWRCLFGAAALLALCLWLGVFKVPMSARHYSLAIAGGVAIVLNWLLLFGSYSRASISLATAVYNLQPFMLLGLGAVFLKERITLGKIGWLLLAFAGVIAIITTRPNAGYVGSDYPLGIAMALLAGFGWAIAALTTKQLTGIPPQRIALIHVVTGSLMLWPFVDWSALPSKPQTWTILVTMGIVHTGLMYALLYSAVQKLPTHVQGALSFIYPVATILIDVFALGHRLEPVQMVGIGAILIAAAGMALGARLWASLQQKPVAGAVGPP
jgi:drug/metabolite transporter (DMT)-like permease